VTAKIIPPTLTDEQSARLQELYFRWQVAPLKAQTIVDDAAADVFAYLATLNATPQLIQENLPVSRSTAYRIKAGVVRWLEGEG
jgi:hypothetical protein